MGTPIIGSFSPVPQDTTAPARKQKESVSGGDINSMRSLLIVGACLPALAWSFGVNSRFGAVRSTHHQQHPSALQMSDGEFDFDVAIIGCGVGGHGCALHARGQSLKTAVFAGGDVGGTCVNRGCVPSKALLAASGRVRDMKDAAHLAAMGISVNPDDVTYDRAGIAAHAKDLANKIKGNLENSLVSLGVDVIEGRGILTDQPHQIKDSVTGKIYTAK
eukprot:scaffold385262_cov42-Attheya_sp.AAC.2